jgi:hypothetical protein
MPEFKMFDKVLVRNSDKDEWAATFFSHYDAEGQIIAINDAPWEYCIPALGNEDLVGTNRSKWEPKQRDLVAVKDDYESVWHLRIFKELKICDDKKSFVTFGCTSHSGDQEWDYCEPAKNHFEFNS